jgi:hypothetical protein
LADIKKFNTLRIRSLYPTKDFLFMKKNISIWILLIEILAIVVLHANKDNSEKIKDILLKRNQSGLIKATPITPASMAKTF